MSNIDKAIAAYVKLRDKIEAMEKQHKAAKKELVDKQLKLAALIEKVMDSIGTESVKSEHGTAFKAKKDSVKVANKADFSEFIVQEIERDGVDALYLLTLSAAKNAVKDYMAEHEDELPPGIKYETWQEVQVRRS